MTDTSIHSDDQPLGRSNPDIRELLAAEYVLGTLQGPARKRFTRLIKQDREIQDLVSFWETRLADFVGCLPAQAPRTQVWEFIEQRLGFSQPAETTTVLEPAWQRFGKYLVSGMALVVLVVGVRVTAPPPGEPVPDQPEIIEPVYTAEVVIRNKLGGAQWRVQGTPGESEVSIEVINSPAIPSDKDLELWYIADGDSAPVSLGIFPSESGSVQQAILSKPLANGATFAVSLEPAGGSPAAGPTGDVLYAEVYSG